MPENEYFEDVEGQIWAQPGGSNTECYPLDCHDLDGIDEPQGDMTTSLCLQADRTWKTVNRSQGSPGDITFDIETWKPKTQGFLARQVERRCAIPIYIHHAVCGRQDVFNNYDQGKQLQGAMITNKSSSNMVKRRAEPGEASTKVGRTYSFNAHYPAPEYFKLDSTFVDLPSEETEPLLDIVFCNEQVCQSPCGAMEDICHDGFVTADGTAVTSDGNVYYTLNGQQTYVACGTDPTYTDANGGHASAVCFEIDRDTMRWVVVKGTADATTRLEICYTDTIGPAVPCGAAWTVVDVVGAVSTDFANHSGALFALNHRDIWLATVEADIYHSVDGCLTWADQGAPAPGASEVLNYIHFSDTNYGYAVGGNPGNSSFILKTVDGGVHWEEITHGYTTAAATAVATIDSLRAWTTFEDGELYYTEDGGDNWFARVLPVDPAALSDIQFIDEYTGFCCGYRAVGSDDYPIVYRTINGGHDWEYYQYDTAFFTDIEKYGLNALWACDINHVVAIGEWIGAATTPIIWDLECIRPS